MAQAKHAVKYSRLAITEFYPANDDQPWYFKVHTQFTVHWKDIYLVVPEGFETDLASIPQWLQSIIPLVGNHLQAAIVHDMCYRNMIGVSKKDADDMFYDAMRTLGVPWWKRQAMYHAVDKFGSSSFHGG